MAGSTSGGSGQRCCICGATLGRHEAAAGETCATLACKTTLAVRTRERQRAARIADLDAARAWFDGTGEADLAAPSCIGAVPFFNRPLVPADPVRVAQFRTTLESELEQAVPQAGYASVPLRDALQEVGADRVLRAACGTCRGLCCERGGTHAFLTAEELGIQLGRNPFLTKAALLEFYLGCLPERSYEGSCVYQAERGCALPRQARAGICGEYLCKSLHELADAMAQNPAPRVCIASVAEGEVRRAVVVDRGEHGSMPAA